MMPHTRSNHLLAWAFVSSLALVTAPLLTGCGTGSIASATGTASPLQGRVLGGQQPISLASIALYAASSNGPGKPYLYPVGPSLLGNTTVKTDTSGAFEITGDYTCPSASTPVYIVASQGNPGLFAETNNPGIGLMAALGPCGRLTPSTYIDINELTTVAAVWALSPFMSSIVGVGSSPGNVQGLTNAFNSANKLVDTSTGTLGGPSLASGAVLPEGVPTRSQISSLPV